MTYLGDYLGHLLSEIAIARMHGDLETVRIAELYAAHPLLRSMPVPHVRVPAIDLEIPVLISGVDEPRTGDSPRGSAALQALRARFDEVLDAHLARTGITLNTADRAKLTATLDGRLSLHRMPAAVAVGVHRLADDLSATASKVIAELGSAARPGAAGDAATGDAELKEATRVALLDVPTGPPRVRVLVTSSEIRDAATDNNLTKLRLTISEQGVEWTTIETEGRRRDQLVPE
jgi:hypothetical protein